MTQKTRAQLENDPAVITIREANGRVVRGNIHGSAGAIRFGDGATRINEMIRRANHGFPIHAYEPEPGHALSYNEPDFYTFPRPDVLRDETHVDLRGATLLDFEIRADG